MFTNILCPVDFSEHSHRALDVALRLAALAGSHVMVITVVDPLLDAASEALGNRAALTGQTQDALRDMLARTAAAHREPVGITVAVGDAAEKILEHAVECEADLIVMGTQGLEGARRFVFGSTTEAVLRQARVPVMAVPAPEP